MRWVTSALAALLFVSAAGESEAAPEVKMFGASWCGPSRVVKQFLDQNRIPYTYLDVDDDKNREAFRRESSQGGIPLIVIGSEKITGATLPAIATALERGGAAKSMQAPPKSGGGTYGGHSPAWWQSQFRDLRSRIEDLDRRTKAFERVAGDNVEKEVLDRMKDDCKILQASLDQLEVDASNVSLPRNFRE